MTIGPGAGPSASGNRRSSRRYGREIRVFRRRTARLRPDRERTIRLLRRLGSYDLRLFGQDLIAGVLLSLLRNCDSEIGPVRRAEEAAGHASQVVLGGFLARTELARALAGDVAECAPERSQALPSCLERDL